MPRASAARNAARRGSTASGSSRRARPGTPRTAQVAAVGLERVAREPALEFQVGEEVEQELLETRGGAAMSSMAKGSARAPPAPLLDELSQPRNHRAQLGELVLEAARRGRPGASLAPAPARSRGWIAGTPSPRRAVAGANGLAEPPARLLLAGPALEAHDQRVARRARSRCASTSTTVAKSCRRSLRCAQLARRLGAAQHQQREQRDLTAPSSDERLVEQMAVLRRHGSRVRWRAVPSRGARAARSPRGSVSSS